MSSTDAAVEARPIRWYWYVLAFAAYVVLGFFFKSLVLNWIVGPTWLVVWLYIVPRGLRGRGTQETGLRR